MDSRERTFLALDHSTPDRIPVDFWASRAFFRKLQAETGAPKDEFLDLYDIDFRYIEGPEYIGPPLESSDGASTDVWGVPRTIAEVPVAGGVETYEEVTHPPLAAAARIEDVLSYRHWPSPDWFRYDTIEAQCDAVRRRRRVVVFMGDRLNRISQLKPAMYLRGVEQILVDLAENPDLARAIFIKIRNFYIAYLERILEAARGKIDIVLTGDDFGSQNAPLVSPAMWDEFIRDGFASYLRLIHNGGARSMHHTCGSVVPIIPKMIACGLDVLQSLQPEAAGMDAQMLKTRFGAQLSFQGGVSIQKTMPFGSPDDIRRDVKHLAETLGTGGGYIFCTSHNVQVDVPVANVDALLDAYQMFGRYA